MMIIWSLLHKVFNNKHATKMVKNISVQVKKRNKQNPASIRRFCVIGCSQQWRKIKEKCYFSASMPDIYKMPKT